MTANKGTGAPSPFNWCTERDREIVRFLYDADFATVAHISGLFFDSPRTAQDRLAKLIQHRIVTMVRHIALPNGTHRDLPEEGEGRVLSPGRNGLRYVCEIPPRVGGLKHDLDTTERALAGVEFYCRCCEQAEALSDSPLTPIDLIGGARFRRALSDLPSTAPRLWQRISLNPAALVVFYSESFGTRTVWVEPLHSGIDVKMFVTRASDYNSARTAWANRPASLSMIETPPLVLAICNDAPQAEQLYRALRSSPVGFVPWCISHQSELSQNGPFRARWLTLRGSAATIEEVLKGASS